MNNSFSIRMCSDLDYEEMVADICWGNDTVALISQENGTENMEIEIYQPLENMSSWKFPLDEFVNIVQAAKKRLIEMNR